MLLFCDQVFETKKLWFVVVLIFGGHKFSVTLTFPCNSQNLVKLG